MTRKTPEIDFEEFYAVVKKRWKMGIKPIDDESLETFAKQQHIDIEKTSLRNIEDQRRIHIESQRAVLSEALARIHYNEKYIPFADNEDNKNLFKNAKQELAVIPGIEIEVEIAALKDAILIARESPQDKRYLRNFLGAGAFFAGAALALPASSCLPKPKADAPAPNWQERMQEPELTKARSRSGK